MTNEARGHGATGAFLLVVVLGVSVYLAVAGLVGSPAQPSCWTGLSRAYELSLGNGTYFFGNTAEGGPNPPSWQLLNDTLVATSYVVGRALNTSLEMFVYTTPSESSQDTTLYMGLYVDGSLVANNTLVHPPSMGDTQVYGVSVPPPLDCPIPSGTVVTMTFYAATPILVQTAQAQSAHVGPSGPPGQSNYTTAPVPSYEFVGAPPLPAALPSPSTGVAVPGLVMDGEGW
jgi:hypothetical protein